MSEFNSSPIDEVLQIRPTPLEGSGIVPTPEIIDTLTTRSEWSPEARAVIGSLLGEAGVVVDTSGLVDLGGDANVVLTEKIDAKKQGVQEVYNLSNELLPAMKRNLVVGLSSYAEGLGIDSAKVTDVISHRIVSLTEVKVDDPLSQNKSFPRVRAAAHFDNHDDTLRISPKSMVSQAEVLNMSLPEAITRDVTHELMHAGSFRAESTGTNYVTRAGLGAMAEFGEESPLRDWTGSTLLDEGAQEDIRWRHLDGAPPSYEKSVMFWEAAIALDPSLETDRFTAKFFNENRGVLVGKIESIFGPGAVETIEDTLADYPNVSDYPDWKDKLVSMIDVYDEDPAVRNVKTEIARLKARNVMNAVQSEIFSVRGPDWDLTDVEWREYKAAKDAAKDEPLSVT